MKILLLALLSPVSTFASPVEAVEVNWRVRYHQESGIKISEPSKKYVSTLKRCGYSLPKDPIGFIPIAVLQCEGVLDKTQHKELAGRVVALTNRAILKLGESENPLFRDLLARLKSVKFAVSPVGVFQSVRDGLGSPRQMGINIESLRLVILNKEFWKLVKTSEFADAFLLHEALGAAGYADVNYETSLALVEAAKGNEIDPPHLSTAVEIPYQIATRDGSISVVGSGGDQNQQAFKGSLMNAINQNIEFIGVDPKFVPTQAELRALIRTLSVTQMPGSFFQDKRDLCRSDDAKMVNKFLCGGFVLNGAEGKPFLLITQDWASAPIKFQEMLLQKIFVSIVSELVQEKMQ